MRRAVWAEGCLTRPLVLHADNGSPMKGATMKATLERLGVIAFYSRPRVSDDNPFSEALSRTCKYRPDWPTSGFASGADAQHWVACFRAWYNHEHQHSAIHFVMPGARHAGEDRALLERRTQLYTEARAANPTRWSRHIRNWEPVGDVCLNPERDISDREIRDAP